MGSTGIFLLLLMMLFFGLALGGSIQKSIEKSRRKKEDEKNRNTPKIYLVITDRNEFLGSIETPYYSTVSSFVSDCQTKLALDGKLDRTVFVYEATRKVRYK